LASTYMWYSENKPLASRKTCSSLHSSLHTQENQLRCRWVRCRCRYRRSYLQLFAVVRCLLCTVLEVAAADICSFASRTFCVCLYIVHCAPTTASIAMAQAALCARCRPKPNLKTQDPRARVDV
jgi:hypothetical protein